MLSDAHEFSGQLQLRPVTLLWEAHGSLGLSAARHAELGKGDGIPVSPACFPWRICTTAVASVILAGGGERYESGVRGEPGAQSNAGTSPSLIPHGISELKTLQFKPKARRKRRDLKTGCRKPSTRLFQETYTENFWLTSLQQPT